MEDKITGAEFEVLWRGPYCSLSYNTTLELAVCKAEREYIPIQDFKSTFQEISTKLEILPIRHLLFDKQNLRTFDQPSMEWYFAVWKAEVKKKGLTNHYKILPDLLWFKKAVEAGKDEIFQKYPGEMFSGISVNYVNDLSEVMKLLKQK